MGKEIALSNIGLLLGIVGIIIAVIPFLSSIDLHLYSIFLPILLGIIGFVLVFKIKKQLNDDIVKAGLILNPIAIILGLIQILV